MSRCSEIFRLNILLPLAERIKGTNAHYWYRQICKMHHWTSEEIKSWQNERLRAFVKHAYEHTAYYHSLFDELRIRPEEICSREDLKKLPILTKDIIRTRYKDFIPDNLANFRYRAGTTGGTTGSPMHYLCHEDVWGFVTASKIDAWRHTGYRYGDKFAALGSSSIFMKKPPLVRRIYDLIRREIGMNSMNMSDELCAEYIERMRREHIHYLYGYASAVYLLAKYAAVNNVDVTFVKAVFTTSENLTETYRRLIENTFQCRVMDSYGARDAGITAFEIEPHRYYVGYDVIPEVVDEFAEREGTLLSTCFLNYAFPLIRYDFGDIVQLQDIDCPERGTYNGDVITKIDGRKSDVLRLDNGHTLTSPGFTILMNKFDVVAYDIQKISGKEVKMQIQPIQGKWDASQESNLIAEMRRFIGDNCGFSLEYVDGFSELKNGKRRYFMNDCSV